MDFWCIKVQSFLPSQTSLYIFTYALRSFPCFLHLLILFRILSLIILFHYLFPCSMDAKPTWPTVCAMLVIWFRSWWWQNQLLWRLLQLPQYPSPPLLNKVVIWKLFYLAFTSKLLLYSVAKNDTFKEGKSFLIDLVLIKKQSWTYPES